MKNVMTKDGPRPRDSLEVYEVAEEGDQENARRVFSVWRDKTTGEVMRKDGCINILMPHEMGAEQGALGDPQP
jgi:hypothetical protein